MRKNLIIALLSITLGSTMLAGCGNNKQETVKEPQKQEQTQETKEEKKEEKTETIPMHKIGEKVELSDATVSVINLRKLDTTNTVYAVEIEITNTGKEDLKSDFLNHYTLKDNENRKGQAINNQDLKGDLLFDTIAPGQSLKGEIAYELQDSATPKTIKICYNSTEDTTFNLE